MLIINNRDIKELEDLLKNVPDSLKRATNYITRELQLLLIANGGNINEGDIFTIYCTIFVYMVFDEEYYKPEVFKNPPSINLTQFMMNEYTDVKHVKWYIMTCIDTCLITELPNKYTPEVESEIMVAIKTWFERVWIDIKFLAMKYIIGFKQAIASYLYNKDLYLVVRYEVKQPNIKFGNYKESEEKIIKLIKEADCKKPTDGFLYEMSIRPFSNKYTRKFIEGDATIVCIRMYSFSENYIEAVIKALEDENVFHEMNMLSD